MIRTGVVAAISLSLRLCGGPEAIAPALLSIGYLGRDANFYLGTGTPLAPYVQAASEAGRALAHAGQAPVAVTLAAIGDIRIQPDPIIADPNGKLRFRE